MDQKKSLYTKYRPTDFSKVIGQDVAKNILLNSIKKNKINHAYIFYGIRGTGKTTLARIFAKSINCRKFDNDPCNKCQSCNEISNGSSFDIVEIDAASNNGVDEIRQIKENTNFTTTNSKYKVYIIDEVHMLTKQAFNALLKTLEEPPKNTIFLLVTTDLQKIPQTVISRTINIRFEILSKDDIKEGIKYILSKENVSFEEVSIDYLVMLAEGSLRDAISLLETTLLYNDNLTAKNVITSLGLINPEIINKWITSDIKSLIKEISTPSVDPKRISIIIIDILMDLVMQGSTKYIDLMNDILFYVNKIKDPYILRTSLKSALLVFDTAHNRKDVSRETINNNNSFKTNIEPVTTKSSENVSRETTKTKEIEDPNKTIENNSFINDTNELNKTIETTESNHTEEQNIQEENVSRETSNDTGLKVITDYVDYKNYLYVVTNDDKEKTENIKSGWKYISNHLFDEDYKSIAYILSKGEALVSSEKVLVVGFKKQNYINDYKRISLEPSTLEFTRKMFGEYKFILPIDNTKWETILAAKSTYNPSPDQKDINLNFEDFTLDEDKIKKEKIKEIFE